MNRRQSPMQQPDLPTLLSELLQSGAESLTTHAFELGDLKALTLAGFLVEQGTIGSIWCDNCDDGHLASVESHPVTGRPAIRCPESGYHELTPAEVRALRVDVETMLNQLRSALAIPRGRQECLIDGLLWFLGPMKTDALTIDVFLARGPEEGFNRSKFSESLKSRSLSKLALLLHPFQEEPGPLPDDVRPITIKMLFRDPAKLIVDSDHLELIIQRTMSEDRSLRPGRRSGIDATRQVLDYCSERGILIDGGRPGARAIIKNWNKVFPGEPVPKDSTIRNHLRKLNR